MTKPKTNAPAIEAAPPVAPAATPPAPAPAPAVAAATPFRYTIEDNIPLPTKRVVSKGESAYPYASLTVGQSFFVPVSDRMKEPWKTLTSMSSRISREMHPLKFTTARATDADGNEGVRVWRTKDTDQPLAEPKTINRKPRKDSVAERERLAAEAAAGDTSQRQHPTPDFVDGATPPAPPAPQAPPPPPPPAA